MNSTEELVASFVEVQLPKEESFLVVKETLERMGVGVFKSHTLYPSCILLHKKGKYYIVHFKEMFLLDQKPTDFSENDKARRNTIVYLLQEWGLVKVLEPTRIEDPRVPVSQIKIIPFQEKKNWNVVHKYSIGI